VESKRKNRRAQRAVAEAQWKANTVADVDPELLTLATAAAERELKSREGINSRLTATITFSGALLAAAFAIGQKAGELKPAGTCGTLFEISFVTAVALLVVTLALALSALLPEPRHRTNPELLKHYTRASSAMEEVRVDTYKLEVALLAQLGEANTSRAKILRLSQYVLGVALAITAGGALILFFSSP